MKKIKSIIRLLQLCILSYFGMISAQKHEQVIKDYINSERSPLQRVENGLKAFTIINVDPSASLRGDVVGIQQVINGIPVYGSSANILVRENKVLSFADTFVKSLPGGIKGKESKSKDDLVSRTVQKLNGLSAIKNIDGKEEPIKVNTVYYVKEGVPTLGYHFNFEEKASNNVWNVIINTEDGSIMYQENTTLSCSFHPDAYQHQERCSSHVQFPENMEYNTSKLSQNFVLAPDNASYNVLAFPVEAPTFGSRILISNPWDLTASPEGWHSDGTNHYTITRGNNVFAYTDEANTNTPQFSPDGGVGRVFNYPLDITQPPQNYTSAAVTNLFYANNKVHDLFYKFGFTESARNYQTNNFGNGGAGNDPVLAEARDGSGLNNANFNPGTDGTSGRMQMYLFSPRGARYLYYNAPSGYISRAPSTAAAAFGPAIMGNPPVTGNLSLSTPADACTTVAAGSLTGKIAVVSGAGCAFTVKTKNLQNAGAIGVIQYNPTSDTPVTMGGADATITIPSIMVGKTEGEFLVNDLTNGIIGNATLKTEAVHRDASLDNGIMIHEYGHGISNRLTGTGNGCLNYGTSNEQMGEGWSDFFALMATNRPGDNASVPRGIGTFAFSESIDGGGIRPARYSPDFMINNYTYGKTNGMKVNDLLIVVPITRPDVHSIGFVWATMLWDLHWKYVEKYGYSSDVLANPNSGSSRVLQLVMDALKLQICNPNFIKGRDAILAAEMAQTNGIDKCMIWSVFAKRGLGVNAVSGGLNGLYIGWNNAAPDLNDQVEDFTVPSECGTLAVNEVANSKGISIYPNPVRNEFTIKLPSDMKLSGITNVSVYDFTGKMVLQENINLNKENRMSVDKLINGVYIVKVNNESINYTQKIIVSK